MHKAGQIHGHNVEGQRRQKLVLLAPRTSTDKTARALRHKIGRTRPLGANAARGVQKQGGTGNGSGSKRTTGKEMGKGGRKAPGR